jgi:DNA repair protein RAD50
LLFSGKTTIIEALKYICTGSQPPLSDGGKSFILDPRIVGKPLVLAQIRFSFQNEQKQQDFLVLRSFQLSQKNKGKREFKAIESILQMKDLQSQTTDSISNRCTDMEKLVPHLMGVSKAVLENVIFVHQEESYWPLGDAKSLKSKFDDIFNATRYTKALETIQKLRKERMSALRMIEQELNSLKSDQELAYLKKDQLEGTKKELSQQQAIVSKLNVEIKQVESDQILKQRQKDETESLRSKIAEFETEARSMTEEVQKAQERMKAIYEEDDKQLEQAIKSNQLKKTQLDRKITEIQKKVNQLQGEIVTSERDYDELVKRSGAVEAQEEQFNKKKQELMMMGKRMAQIRKISEIQSFDQFRLVSAAFQKYLESYERECSNAKSSASSLDNDQEAQINQSRLKLSKLQESLKVKVELARNNRDKHEKFRMKEEQLTAKFHGKLGMDKEMEQAEQAIREFETSQTIENYRKQLEITQRKAEQNSISLKQLQFERKQLASQQEEFAAIKLKQAQLEEKAKAFNELAEKFPSSISLLPAQSKEICSAILSPSFLGSLRLLEQNSSEKVKQLKSAQEKNQLTLKRFHSELEVITRELIRLQDRLEVSDKKRLAIISTFERYNSAESLNHSEAEFRSLIAQQAEKVKKRQEDEAIITSSEFLYTRFIDHARLNSECSLCMRKFENQQQVEKFIQERTNILGSANSEEKLEAIRGKLAQAVEKHRILQSLLPQLIEFKQLENVEIPNNQQQIKEIKVKVKEAEQMIAITEKEQNEVINQEKTSHFIWETSKQIQLIGKEISSVGQSIENAQIRLVELSEGGRSIEFVVNECEEAERESSRLTQLMFEIQSKLNDSASQKQRLQDRVNLLKDQKLEFSETQTELKNVQEQQEELRVQQPIIREEINKMDKEIKPLEATISALEKARAESRERESKEEKERDALLVTIRREVDQFNGLMKEIMTFESLTASREQNKLAIQEAKQRIELVKKSKNERESELQAFHKEFADSEVEMRDVQANLDFRERERALEAHKLKLLKAKQELTAIAELPIDQELALLTKKLTKLKEKRAETVGIIATTEKHAKTLMTELNMQKFSQIDQRYKDKLIEATTTKMAIDDLGQYYKALDMALMNFHSAKMEEINEILKDYWRTVYQGQDIDEIYIKSAHVTEDSRRSYTYSVMMKQGDIELEMRGRCSTGQRVIASLLIRLALADVFCLACGVLALDEPTTNLDHRNVKAFAQALNEILNKRRHQSNFQLIVITHDEHFVDEIGRRAHAEYYYRVFKNEHNHSMIRKQPMNSGELE